MTSLNIIKQITLFKKLLLGRVWPAKIPNSARGNVKTLGFDKNLKMFLSTNQTLRKATSTSYRHLFRYGTGSFNLVERIPQISTRHFSNVPNSVVSSASGGGGPGEESEEEQRKKKENAARALKYTLYAFGGLFLSSAGYSFFVWGAPQVDNFGNEIKDEFSDLPYLSQYFYRCLNEIRNYKIFLAEPSREKLLPDPVKLPYIQPPYTLLLEITDVLVHPEWTYRTGWRFRKRPGVEYFLNQVGGGLQFEIVIYTQESGFTALPIVDALDSKKVVMYTLFRDSTKYTDGHHVKDLDRINRDLKKVIMIDCNGASVQNHRHNAIVLPKWFGNDDDRALFDLAALLLTISNNEIYDVREVLSHYSKYDDPIAEFRQKQREYAEKERERDELLISLKQKAPGVKVPGFNFIPSFLRKS